MKIDIIKEESKKLEVPFVVGGVYKFKSLKNGYRILVNFDNKYLFVDLDSGRTVGQYQNVNDTVLAIRDMYLYEPDICLVIKERRGDSIGS